MRTYGEMRECPFRIFTEKAPVYERGGIDRQKFMPCLKDRCICYKRTENEKAILEECHREHIVYERVTAKGENNE